MRVRRRAAVGRFLVASAVASALLMGTGLQTAAAAPVGVPTGESGTVTGWGGNWDGQQDQPTDLTDVTAIAAGSNHSLALTAGGTVVAWGSNGEGQSTVPTGLTDVTAISARLNHSLALKSDGTVVAWGSNDFGQSNVPTGLVDVTAIASGLWFNVALKSDGTVVAWGNNSYGQLNVPNGLTGVTAISAGGYHTVALTGAGTTVVWGNNDYDQLAVPSGLTGVTAVATGEHHSLALTEAGTIVSWGLASTGATTVPADLPEVVAIAAGNYYSMALTRDGTVRTWGSNPGVVPDGLNGVIALAGGYSHALALVADVPAFTADAPSLGLVAGSPVSYQFATENAATFVSANPLPSGLTLTSGGLLAGTITEVGEYDVQVVATSGIRSTNGTTHTFVVTAGALAELVVTPPEVGFVSIAGQPLTFAVAGEDAFGNATSVAASYTTSLVGSDFADVIDGDTITFYKAGVRTVTVTVGSVSTSFDVEIAASATSAVELASSSMTAIVDDTITLSLNGTDAYGNETGDLASQAVFTSDWASDVIDGATVRFTHASVHTLTGTFGGLTSTVAIELSDPVGVAAALAAAQKAAEQAATSVEQTAVLAQAGSNPAPGVLAGGMLLVLGLALCLRRRVVA
ncbi:putative Ig domain-containing protein [Cryobacterium glaciale]|nr:putative Ig domain-containing protein [Cryobacterium glaciale]